MHKMQNIKFFDLLRRNFLIFLSAGGIIVAITFSLIFGEVRDMPANSLKTPPEAPFVNNIAGIGIIESSCGNVNIGAFNPGIVSEVLVKENDKIKVGSVLFKQDHRSFAAALEVSKDNLKIAKHNVELAEIEFTEQNNKYKRSIILRANNNISEEVFETRKFAFKKAEMDLLIKKSYLSEAEHNLKLAEIALDKTVITSPIDGLVLKVRIRPGEFISGSEQNTSSPMLIGSINPLYLRVKIDENDMWRFKSSMKAYAYLRSNKEISSSISFVRIEPYAAGKDQLRGTGIELIDTRIIDIVYKIEDNLDKFYIGQQLDVFIESSNGP